MKRRTVFLIVFSVVILCAVSVVLWYQSTPSPTQKAIQKVLNDPTAATRITQQKDLPAGLDEFLAWYTPRVQNASPEVQALMKAFDAKFRGADEIHMELEEMFPTDEWLQRHLDMGIEISDFSDYSGALNLRLMLYHTKNDPVEFAEELEWHGLPPNAPFEALITAKIRFSAKLDEKISQAEKDDPLVYGGEMGPDGVFIPIRFKTVYVQRDESGGGMTAGSGVPRWVIDELVKRDRGLPSKEIPEDITVIYLDEKGTPIPPKEAEITPPSEQSPTAEREQVIEGTREETDKGEARTVDSEHPPERKSADRSMPPKPPTEPLTLDQLPKSEADWERLLTQPLDDLSKSLSEDGLRSVAETLNQYGVEEGIKRIEATDPALAQRLRQRLLSNRRANPRQTTPPAKQGPVGNENRGK